MLIPGYKAHRPIAVIIPVLFLVYAKTIVVVTEDNSSIIGNRNALQRVGSGGTSPYSCTQAGRVLPDLYA